MIRWTDASADVAPLPIEALYGELSVTDIVRIEGADDPLPLLLIPGDVRATVWAHARSSDLEVGGLLVGTAYVDDQHAAPVRLVRLREAVPADDYASSAVSLRLESGVWSKVRPLLGGGVMVVGWYHSHPHLGAFFSGTDRRTQRGFFHHDYSLGWVVDPFADESTRAEAMFVGAASVALPGRRVHSTR